MRFLQIFAVFLIPVGAIALALTFRSSDSKPPLLVTPRTGSYEAVVGTPLSVTAFRVVNTSDSTVTLKRVRVLEPVSGLRVIGALAYRGCSTCVVDSAVPPSISSGTDAPPPPLLAVTSFRLKPGAQLTLLLSVSLSRAGRVHVPPLRMDVETGSGVRNVETVQGPELCAGKTC